MCRKLYQSIQIDVLMGLILAGTLLDILLLTPRHPTLVWGFGRTQTPCP